MTFGKGSRVAIGGAPGGGRHPAAARDRGHRSPASTDLELSVVLVGARPEEVTEWRRRERRTWPPSTAARFDRSLEGQVQTAELAVERAKRVAERGGDAAVADRLARGAARRAARRRVRRRAQPGGRRLAHRGRRHWHGREPQRYATTRVHAGPARLAVGHAARRPARLGAAASAGRRPGARRARARARSARSRGRAGRSRSVRCPRRRRSRARPPSRAGRARRRGRRAAAASARASGRRGRAARPSSR